MKIKQNRRHIDYEKNSCDVSCFIERGHTKGTIESIECYIQELKENVDGTPRAQKMTTSHNERIDEILGYDNGE